MWRVGHDYNEKKSGNAKTAAKSRKTKDAQGASGKNRGASRDSSKFAERKPQLKKRKPSEPSNDFFTVQKTGIGGGVKHIPDDRVHQLIPDDFAHHARERRFTHRPSESRKLTKVREIQERINRVISYYDDAPIDGENSTVEELLQSVEEGLNSIPDDMLRINISSLVGQHRILQRIEEDRRQEVRDFTDHHLESHDTLVALQNWLEQDHLEGLDSDEFGQNFDDEFDKEVVHAEISQIKGKMHKLIELKQRIRRLKTSGNNTYHLERQKENLHDQMKSEVKRLRVKRKSSVVEPNTEYDYLKNATKEVYDIIQKTKLEGMAQAAQFEAQLKKILKELDEAKAEIKSLQDLTSSQREQITKWSKDYDKLHNELMITVDERNMSRDDSRNLRSEILQLKQKLFNFESKVPTEETVSKTEHIDIVLKLEKALKLAKQNLLVVTRTLEEKERVKNELANQCHRLKASLRKMSSSVSSNISVLADSDYHSSASDVSSIRSFHASSVSREDLKIYNSSTESLVNPNSEIINALRKELETMKERLEEAQQDKSGYRHTRSPSPSKSYNYEYDELEEDEVYKNSIFGDEVSSKQTQTPPVKLSATKSLVRIGDGPQSRPQVETESVACQTDASAQQLPYMSPTEQVQMSNICRTLAENVGDQWLDMAKRISFLEPEDLNEIHKGLSVEHDYKNIFSGASKEFKSSTPRASDAKVETVAEKMLRGESPSTLETQFREQDRKVQEQIEEMKETVTKYVSGIRAAVNSHAGVMNVVNDEIKKIIGPHPSKVKSDIGEEQSTRKSSQIDEKPAAVNKSLEDGYLDVPGSGISIEMPQELGELSSLERANCKIEMIEKTLFNLISETKDIYSSEVEKEHETYKKLRSNARIHTSRRYPVRESNVDRKIDTIKEKVKFKVSEAHSKSLPKASTSVILRSRSWQSGNRAAPLRHAPRQENTFAINALPNHSNRGQNRLPSASSSTMEQRQNVQKILSGQFWQYSGQQSPSDMLQLGNSFNTAPLAPISEESYAAPPNNFRNMPSLSERYGQNVVRNNRNFANVRRNDSSKPAELGLFIQSTPLKKSNTTLSPIHRNVTSHRKDLPILPRGRLDPFSIKPALPQLQMNQNRRTRHVRRNSRSGDLNTLADFRVQSFKAFSQQSPKNASQRTNNFTTTKLPYIMK